MLLNIQIDSIILKTDDEQFTLTTKKSLHITVKTYYAPMPLTMPNFIALGQTVYEKSVIFLQITPFIILAPQGDPFGQSSPLWVATYSKAPSINVPNFVEFVDGEIHKNTKTVNDIVSTYHAVTKNI